MNVLIRFSRMLTAGLLSCLVLESSGQAQNETVEKERPALSEDYQWTDATELTIEGKGWADTDRPYVRLPKKAESIAPSRVWELSRNSAGIYIRFVTDSPNIAAAWDGGGAMNHMAATGNSGLDLYRRTEDGWKFVGVGRPQTEWTETRVAKDQPETEEEYMLYLPLYNDVTELFIGIDSGREIKPGPRWPEARSKPIVFYGTSIVQGGCASRAGMAHPEILGRWFDREVINLGFSGAGKMEPELAELYTDLDAEIFVLDCLPNMTVEMTEERVAPFVRTLKDARPEMPIVLVESPTNGADNPQNTLLREAFETLKEEGYTRLYMIDWETLWAGRENPTVDGVHPTDLGFLRMAEAHEPVFKKVLEDSGKM